MTLDSGALRQYEEAGTAAFLRDLLDGYFPYELKHAFPEGVLFQVCDQTSRPHGIGGEYEWGEGRKLDSRGSLAATPSPEVHASASGMLVPQLGRCSSLTVGTRLWTNPVANPLAKSVEGVAAGSDGPEELIDAAGSAAAAGPICGAGALLCGGAADGGASPSGGGGGTCRVQIKGTDGQAACVLELPNTATLASVHAAILDRGIIPAAAKYELRTAFPPCPLTEPSRTLEDLGLTPSVTLLVRETGAAAR